MKSENYKSGITLKPYFSPHETYVYLLLLNSLQIQEEVASLLLIKYFPSIWALNLGF